MLLEAVNQGLGALWNGLISEGTSHKIADIIGVDNENIKPYCIITLGYPAEGLENKFMDKYDESRIHYETY